MSSPHRWWNGDQSLQLLESLFEPVIVLNPSGKVEWVNPAAAELTGQARETLVGREWPKLGYLEKETPINDLLKRGFCKGESITGEFAVSPRGLNLRFTAHPLFDTEDNITHLVLLLRDLTEQNAVEALEQHEAEEEGKHHKAEAALQRSESRYRSLVENASEVVYSLDLGGNLTFLNPAFSTLTGFSRNDWLGRPFKELIHPDDLPVAIEHFQRVLRGERTPLHELRVRSKSNPYLIGEFRTTPLQEEDKVVGLWGIARDITPRKEAEQMIKKQNEFLYTIIESLSHPFYVINADDYTITLANSATRLKNHYENATCYALTHNLNSPCSEEGHSCPLEIVKKTNKPTIMEHIHYDKDDNQRHVEIHAYPIFDGEGHLHQMIEYCLDITDRKALQQQLLLSERLAAIGQLAAGVAHELNTPLANISLLADNLLETTADEGVVASTRQVLEQVDYAAHIVQDLLNFSRPATLEIENIDLHELLETALKDSGAPAWLKVERRLEPHLPPLKGDRVHLKEVFINLIRNGVDAMAERGRGTLALKTRRFDSKVEVTLRDTGPGIPPEVLDHIFEPFFSTKSLGRGTGLGLPIVQRLLHEHGGTIKVKSKPGLGTSVRVILPLDPKPSGS